MLFKQREAYRSRAGYLLTPSLANPTSGPPLGFESAATGFHFSWRDEAAALVVSVVCGARKIKSIGETIQRSLYY